MSIPSWISFICVVFLAYWFIKKIEEYYKNDPNKVENIEHMVYSYYKQEIFNLELFDSPHFIDYQDAFDAMDVNYLRLKERFVHDPKKVAEIAKDWYRYAEALHSLKQARLLLDFDLDDDAWDKAAARMKEPTIIKEEIEKKFKTLLGKDFQKIPPNYFVRTDTMKKPNEKTKKELGLNEWKYYYGNSANYLKIIELRRKEEKEKNKKK